MMSPRTRTLPPLFQTSPQSTAHTCIVEVGSTIMMVKVQPSEELNETGSVNPIF